MLDKSGRMMDELASNTVTQYPLDVAADSSGNVYVLEYANNRIKVFDSAGTYLRSFGGYGSGCNQWKYARQFTIFNDQVYLADHQGNRVLKLSLTGQCIASGLTYWTKPFGIAVNSNYVFVGHYGDLIETLVTGNLSRTV